MTTPTSGIIDVKLSPKDPEWARPHLKGLWNGANVMKTLPRRKAS